MNLNSQSLFYPPQTDNPSDNDRHFLAQYALNAAGRPEDLRFIIKNMAPPQDITNYARPGEFKKYRIAVIGGGLAGLSAAFELRKLGFDITIYEALENRIGGRVYTYYFDDAKTLHGEFGAMRIPVTHETVWHYLKLFNIPTRPFIQYNENTFIYYRSARAKNNRTGSEVSKKIYPKYNLNENERNTNWQTLQRVAIENHLLYAPPQVRAEIIQVRPFYSPQILSWSDNSSVRMMESARLSQEAINLVSNFAPLLYSNLYKSYIDYIQETYPADLSYLYEIPSGMVKLPEAFLQSLNNPNPIDDYPYMSSENIGNVIYKAGCWVKDIGFDNINEKVNLGYENKKVNALIKEEFDYVVCAIPFSSLRNVNINPLFSYEKMRAIREVYYTPSQKTLFLCRQRFWEKSGIIGGGSFTDLPISSTWYPSDHAKYISNTRNSLEQLKNIPYNEPGVLLASYNFGLDTTRLTNQDTEAIFSEVKRELEMVHGLPPNYLDNIVKDYKFINWEHEPSFRGALTFFETQQKELFSYSMALPEYNNRVFFAGEHISAVHRWMQGALQSGMQAANNLAIACKINKK